MLSAQDRSTIRRLLERNTEEAIIRTLADELDELAALSFTRRGYRSEAQFDRASRALRNALREIDEGVRMDAR
jgi:hypothetical protein